MILRGVQLGQCTLGSLVCNRRKTTLSNHPSLIHSCLFGETVRTKVPSAGKQIICSHSSLSSHLAASLWSDFSTAPNTTLYEGQDFAFARSSLTSFSAFKSLPPVSLLPSTPAMWFKESNYLQKLSSDLHT